MVRLGMLDMTTLGYLMRTVGPLGSMISVEIDNTQDVNDVLSLAAKEGLDPARLNFSLASPPPTRCKYP